MSAAVLVDTSAFYALQNLGDPKERQAAIDVALQLEREEAVLITTDYILDESYTLLRSALGHAAAVGFGHEIRNGDLGIIQVDPSIQDEAWDIFERFSDKDFSFTDCTSFVVMRRGRVKVAFTFDRHFQQYGFQTLPAKLSRGRR